jgi:hypothetical protein
MFYPAHLFPSICSAEANKSLDAGPSFLSFFPDWRTALLFKEWQKYAKKCYRGGMHDLIQSCTVSLKGLSPILGDVQTTQKNHFKTITTPIPITIKSNGCPDIPTVTIEQGYKTKIVQTMLREYCTEHIRKYFSVNVYIYVTQIY